MIVNIDEYRNDKDVLLKLFANDIRLEWSGIDDYTAVLSEAFLTYIVTDDFTDKTEDERRDYVFLFKQVKSILDKINDQIINV